MSAADVDMEFETVDLDQAARITGAPSADWLRRKLNERKIPGRRAGRRWRMTRSDMAAAVEYMKRPAKVAPADDDHAPADAPKPTGLTARASRNLARSA